MSSVSKADAAPSFVNCNGNGGGAADDPLVPTTAPPAAVFLPSSVSAPIEDAEVEIGEAIHAAVRPFLECGDRVVKMAHCRQHYSAVLLSNGRLLAITRPAAADGRVLNSATVSPRTMGGDSSTISGAGMTGNSTSSSFVRVSRPTSSMRRRTIAAHVIKLFTGGNAVVDVAAGDEHIVYCTSDGCVYSCGYNNAYGQLGDGTVWEMTPAEEGAVSAVPKLSPPRRIDGFGQALRLTPGAGSSVQLDSHQHISPLTSPLVAPGESYLATKPVLAANPVIREAVGIRAVACGAHHTLLLTEKGNCVYACGRGDHGQLGARLPPPLQPTFRCVRLLFGLPMRSLHAAGDHSFVLLQTGKLLAFGGNVCGQLGFGHTRNIPEPTPVALVETWGVSGTTASTSVGGAPTEPESEPSNGTIVRRAVPLPTAIAPEASDSSPALLDAAAAAVTGATTITTTTTTSTTSAVDHRGAALRTRSKKTRLLDEKAYETLRAPYASVEATYFPLRVRRLDGELEPGQPRAVAVWGCATTTVVLTEDLTWLSCGLPVTRAGACSGAQHLGSYGALGRHLLGPRDGYRFGAMAWTPVLRPVLAAAAAGDADVAAALVTCQCYASSTVVRIDRPGQTTSSGDSADSGAAQPAALVVKVGGPDEAMRGSAPAAAQTSTRASPTDRSPSSTTAPSTKGDAAEATPRQWEAVPLLAAKAPALLSSLGLSQHRHNAECGQKCVGSDDDGEHNLDEEAVDVLPVVNGSQVVFFLRDCVAAM